MSAGATATFFFVNGLAPLVDEISWMQKLTPFFWLQDPNPLANGLDPASTGIFVAATAILLTVAVWAFNRRDIAV